MRDKSACDRWQKPARFRWLAKDDLTSTHLELRTGQEYWTSSVGEEIILRWLRSKKIELFDLPPGEQTPRNVVLEVQNLRFASRSRLGQVVTKENPNG